MTKLSKEQMKALKAFIYACASLATAETDEETALSKQMHDEAESRLRELLQEKESDDASAKPCVPRRIFIRDVPPTNTSDTLSMVYGAEIAPANTIEFREHIPGQHAELMKEARACAHDLTQVSCTLIARLADAVEDS